MDKSELIRLVKAHNWMWERWWPALLELSPEQARKEVGGSFPSVFDTAAHMVWSEFNWQERCDRAGQNTTPEPEDMTVLKQDWEALAERRRKWLETAAPQSPVSYRTSDGKPYTTLVSDIILHMTSHAHFHRGQLVTQFRLLGLKPPSVHFITFTRL
ncbi:MAG: damage-inducible protein DinB [Meiothermus sp.]